MKSLTIDEVRAGILDGSASATKTAELHYARIAADDRPDGKGINSFLALSKERAMAQAAKIDDLAALGDPLPTLAGVPVGIKDVLAMQGSPATAGSKILAGYMPPYDATAVKKLDAAGAVLLGKLNCDEFAMGSSNENSAYGLVKNPRALDRVPGGSSGGSAAAVAAGFAVATLGTDTGGSIRQPAAFCGVVGVLPTYGRVSRYGLIAFASSLDRVGPVTNTVKDAATVLGVLAGQDVMDATSSDRLVDDYVGELTKPVAGLRVGVPAEYFGEGLDDEVKAAVEKTIDQLKAAGCEIKPVSLPHTKYAVPTYYVIATAEASSNLSRFDGVRFGLRSEESKTLSAMFKKTRDEGFGAEVKRRILLGTYALSAGYYDAYYKKAQQVRALMTRDFLEAFAEVDVIVGPVTPTAAFKIGEKADDPMAMYLADIYSVAASLAGICGVSVPCGATKEGLPIGVQIMGKHFDEATILRVGAAVEGFFRVSSSARLWWQDGVVYQIYPRSFQDSNGDGIGDLPGIESRLDYLVELGVDAVWVSPFYPSPMADFGYDVADYTGVDPIFGTLDDFDRLIAAVHARGLKLILDFVPNHTSNQHPWFLESRSSRDNPKRDWYLWRDGRDGTYPNNWMSNFGGPGWTWDDVTQQFYYHSFLKEQPDLNWHNPEVRKAIYDALRFWLGRGPEGKGVDGFRMDVLWLLIKDSQFRDNLPNPEWTEGASTFWSVLPTYTADQPETHEIVKEMRGVLNEYSERVLIGEIYLPLPDLVRYYGNDLDGANLPFNFHLIQTEWNADKIADLIHEYEHVLPPGAWPNWVMGNHDQSRVASRIGAAQARAAAMLLLTLRGTPTMYYGEELGMANGKIAPDQVQDPAEKNQPGIGMGRDPERTPMLWDGSANAGFTTGTPWLPVNADYSANNVAAETADSRSVLALYRSLLQLRQEHPALHAGEIHEVRAKRGVLSYVRALDGKRFQVLLNFTLDVQTANCYDGRVLLTTILDGDGAPVGGPLQIEAGEGLLIAVN